uniref:BHLH domain-containing protein n=1 Tax=Timema douglasi TaxID=61478 RepID=A0A7R8VFW6_TIMDO|nr:unnamed protein product [Timema douglasi]
MAERLVFDPKNVDQFEEISTCPVWNGESSPSCERPLSCRRNSPIRRETDPFLPENRIPIPFFGFSGTRTSDGGGDQDRDSGCPSAVVWSRGDPMVPSGTTPSPVRRRNERERQRVRSVNQGFERLRRRLPRLWHKDDGQGTLRGDRMTGNNWSSRNSKVEVLRTAIAYIRHLQDHLISLRQVLSATEMTRSENAVPFRLPPLTPANTTNISIPPPPSPNFIKPMLLARESQEFQEDEEGQETERNETTIDELHHLDTEETARCPARNSAIAYVACLPPPPNPTLRYLSTFSLDNVGSEETTGPSIPNETMKQFETAEEVQVSGQIDQIKKSVDHNKSYLVECVTPPKERDDEWYCEDKTDNAGNEDLFVHTSFSQQIEHVHQVTGRRIVDITHFIVKMQELNVYGPIGCNLSNMFVVREKKCGYKSELIFKCLMCNIECQVEIEPRNEQVMDINTASVAGSISAGAGYAQLAEIT